MRQTVATPERSVLRPVTLWYMTFRNGDGGNISVILTWISTRRNILKKSKTMLVSVWFSADIIFVSLSKWSTWSSVRGMKAFLKTFKEDRVSYLTFQHVTRLPFIVRSYPLVDKFANAHGAPSGRNRHCFIEVGGEIMFSNRRVGYKVK